MLIVALFFVSLGTFLAFNVLPGDASVSRLGTDVSEERREEVREELGLNKPVMTRYVEWLGKAVRGDFGESFQYSGTSVKELLGKAATVTIWLAVVTFVIMVFLSIPLGILAGKHLGGPVDRIVTGSGRVFMAVPSFFLGILLIYLFSIVLSVIKTGAFVYPGQNFWECIKCLILPSFALGIPKAAMLIRYLRSSIMEEQKKDYVRTAYSKGLSINQVFYGHILRNALIPVVTFLALAVVDIFAGSIVVEQVFSLPGLGKMLVNAITNRDYPVVQGIILILATVVIVVNFFVDLLYSRIDPRISLGGERSKR